MTTSVIFCFSVHETLSDRLTCQTKIISVRQILLLHRTGGLVKFLDENVLTMFRSGKNLIGQANSQTLSDQMSFKVSATFVNTAVYHMTFQKSFLSTLKVTIFQRKMHCCHGRCHDVTCSRRKC